MCRKNVLTIAAVAMLTLAIGQVQVQAETVTVPNGRFDMYKPGTNYTVRAYFPADWSQYTIGLGDNVPLGDGGISNYADGTTGSVIDCPGWINPLTLPAWRDINNPPDGVLDDFTTGKCQLFSWGYDDETEPYGRSSTLNCFGAWSGQSGNLAESAESLGNIIDASTYTLSAMMIGDPAPVTFELRAGGVAITPSSSVTPVAPTTWQVISRTYDAAAIAPYVGQPMTIRVGTTPPHTTAPDDPDRLTGTRLRFDNVTLSYYGPPDVCVVPVAVLVDPAMTSEVRTELPGSITEVPEPGGTCYVEIWASDIGDENTGLTSVYVDMSFCEQMSITEVVHGAIFSDFTEDGTIQPGGIEVFGGSALSGGGGIEPEWVRIGWIEMMVEDAVLECTISLGPSSNQYLRVAATGRGDIDWGSVLLGSVMLYQDCNANGVADPNDIAEGTSLDCNGNGIPDECELEDNDCNGNGIPDECELEDNDCNGNGIPDECDLEDNDCNNNGIPDECELEDNDCNGNGIPDDCELEDNDCNGNGIPDDCDINDNPDPNDADGTSTDVNDDGIPDECQFDVRIEPVVVLNNPNGMSEVRTSLPNSMSAVVRGSTYYVEIWASDIGNTNTGLARVYVDMSFCEQTSATELSHGMIFTTDMSGTVEVGGVDEFGGSALPSGGGIEPEWVRIGWVTMLADLEASTCMISLKPSFNGVERVGDGLINWAFVELGELDIEIAPPARSYDLDGSGGIGTGDLGLFAVSWLEDVPPGSEEHDFNCDCYVGVGDLSWFATGWNKSASDPTILYPPCPNPSCGGEGMMALSDVTAVLTNTWDESIDVAIELAVVDTPSLSDTATLLPESIESISSGDTYYLEVWASDVGYVNTGLTSVYVDISFASEAASVVSVSHGDIFDTLKSGSYDIAGEIDELGGSTPIGGICVEPEWARVAVVEMHADATVPSVRFTISASDTGVASYGRDRIDWNNIWLGWMTIPAWAVCDLYADERIDVADLLLFAEHWLETPCSAGNDWCGWSDFNHIDDVDLNDFAILSKYWLADVL